MTKVSMPIIGWVSEILGWMINVIYSGLELIGITNIGLSIILFTLPSINDSPDQLLICNATAEKAERIGFIHRFALLFPF